MKKEKQSKEEFFSQYKDDPQAIKLFSFDETGMDLWNNRVSSTMPTSMPCLVFISKQIQISSLSAYSIARNQYLRFYRILWGIKNRKDTSILQFFVFYHIVGIWLFISMYFTWEIWRVGIKCDHLWHGYAFYASIFTS